MLLFCIQSALCSRFRFKTRKEKKRLVCLKDEDTLPTQSRHGFGVRGGTRIYQNPTRAVSV